MGSARPAVKPIVKWAGGKRQLLPQLRPYFPREFNKYFEPFVGSAAVFFDLHNTGVLDGHGVLLADSSPDLIGCYIAIRDDVEAVIAALESLQAAHGENARQHYYEVRDRRFNPARQARGGSAVGAYGAELAAMLLYLNRTGYNGLFRLNASGEFNVPAGRYDRPRICDAANLRRAAEAFRRAGLSLEVSAFTETLARAGQGDFVYLDPPYAPVNATSRFTAYTAGGFGSDAQRALQHGVVDLAARGAHVLLSNSATPEVKALYAEDPRVREVGLRTHLVQARRAINSRAAGRGPVLEYVITNVRC